VGTGVVVARQHRWEAESARSAVAQRLVADRRALVGALAAARMFFLTADRGIWEEVVWRKIR
jgi:hypothetical protein